MCDLAATELEKPITPEASASTTAPNSSAGGAIDGDRFAIKPGTFWRGAGEAKTWWRQLSFAEPRPVGAVLQVHGDQPSVLSNAPSRYRWQRQHTGMVPAAARAVARHPGDAPAPQPSHLGGLRRRTSVGDPSGDGR